MGFVALQALKGDLEIQAKRVFQGCRADMVRVSLRASWSPGTVRVSTYPPALMALASSSLATPSSSCMQMTELMVRILVRSWKPLWTEMFHRYWCVITACWHCKIVSQGPQEAASLVFPPCPSCSVTQRASVVMPLATTTHTGCPLACQCLRTWFPSQGTCWHPILAGVWR